MRGSANEKLSELADRPGGSQRTLLARTRPHLGLSDTCKYRLPGDLAFYIPATPEGSGKGFKNRRDALIFCIMDLGDDLLSIITLTVFANG
jgi:hypothetical protein